MGRGVEDNATLKHVAAIGILLSLMVTGRTSRRWGARCTRVLRFLMMVVSVIPAGRRGRFIVLRGRLFQRKVFARQTAYKSSIKISISYESSEIGGT